MKYIIEDDTKFNKAYPPLEDVDFNLENYRLVTCLLILTYYLITKKIYMKHCSRQEFLDCSVRYTV